MTDEKQAKSSGRQDGVQKAKNARFQRDNIGGGRKSFDDRGTSEGGEVTDKNEHRDTKVHRGKSFGMESTKARAKERKPPLLSLRRGHGVVITWRGLSDISLCPGFSSSQDGPVNERSTPLTASPVGGKRDRPKASLRQ